MIINRKKTTVNIEIRYRKTSITMRTKLKSKYGRFYQFILTCVCICDFLLYIFFRFVSLLFFMDAFIWIELWKKQFYYHCAKEKCNVIQKVNWLKGINFLSLFLSVSMFFFDFFCIAGKAKISLEAAVSKLGICQWGRHTHTHIQSHTFAEIFNLNESFVRLHSGELHVPLTT